MRPLVEVLVGISIVLQLWFVIRLGSPRRSENPPIAWLITALTWGTIAFETLLLLALFRIPTPWWIAAVTLAALDGVWAWWLVALHRSRGSAR